MTLLPGTLPRLDQTPYNDPQNFVATWNHAMELIEQASAGSGGTGTGGANDRWFYKSGRKITSPKPAVPPSPALGVWLPAGFEWVQDGVPVTLEEGELVAPLPQNFDGYVAIEAVDDGSGGWEWEIAGTSEERSTLGAGGIGVIGRVATDSVGTVSIGSEPGDADVIYDMPTLVALLGGINSGSGEGEGGLVTMLSQLVYNSADPRSAVTVIEEKLADTLAAALQAAEATGEQNGVTEYDQIWDWLIANRNILGISMPHLLRLMAGAGAQPGLHGTDSAPETEQFDEGGTLPPVPEQREYDSR